MSSMQPVGPFQVRAQGPPADTCHACLADRVVVQVPADCQQGPKSSAVPSRSSTVARTGTDRGKLMPDALIIMCFNIILLSRTSDAVCIRAVRGGGVVRGVLPDCADAIRLYADVGVRTAAGWCVPTPSGLFECLIFGLCRRGHVCPSIGGRRRLRMGQSL
jgi:hypothetical protein